MDHEPKNNAPTTDEIAELEASMPQDGFECMASMINGQLAAIEMMTDGYVDNPSGENYESLSQILGMHYESVEQALKALRKEYDTEEDALPHLMQYCAGLSRRRAALFNGFDFIDDDYKTDKSEEVKDVCEGVEGWQYDAVNLAHGYYHSGTSEEYEDFTDKAIAAHEKKPSTKRKEFMYAASKHTLDIAKVALGVVGGIALAKKSKIL